MKFYGLATSFEEIHDSFSGHYKDLPIIDEVKLASNPADHAFVQTDHDHYLLLPDNKIIFNFNDADDGAVVGLFAFSKGELVAVETITLELEKRTITSTPRGLLKLGVYESIPEECFLTYSRIDTLHSTAEEIESALKLWDSLNQDRVMLSLDELGPDTVLPS